MSTARKYSNATDIPLELAVFLATDHYDNHPNTISATSLIKPIRPLILADRVSANDAIIDISSLTASRIGTAIHDGIEGAWVGHYEEAMRDLGYPDTVIERIRINPAKPTLDADPDLIPIYTEQRTFRDIVIGGKKYTVSGKFDMVCEGVLNDYKKTGTFTYTHATKLDDYTLQGSIYRWLSPKLITADYMKIHYIFLDWQAFKLKSEKNYPPSQLHTIKLPLLSLVETESYIRNKLEQYVSLHDADEDRIPLCTAIDLWQSEPTWKYYKNPATADKGGRSTKNFDTAQGAYARLAEDNNVGRVIEIQGEAKACRYCPAFHACSQKDALIASGSLKL